MLLDTARPRYIWLGMRGRDAVRKLTPKVNILKVFTIDFSEIQFIVKHNSQSDGQNKCAKSGIWTCERRPYIQTHSRGKEKIQRTMISYSEQSREKWTMKLRSDNRIAVMMKNRLHHESGEPIEEPIHPSQQRRIRQGQEVFLENYFSSVRGVQQRKWEYWFSIPSSLWWYASEWSWKWALIFLSLFCYSWFRLLLVAIHCNRREV